MNQQAVSRAGRSVKRSLRQVCGASALWVGLLGLGASGFGGGFGCGATGSGSGPEVPVTPSPNLLPRGLLEVTTESCAAVATTALREALAEAGLGVPLDLDHRAGAEAAGLAMPASTVFVFGNPALGTPLMQENILVALDLPLKMLVSEDANGAVKGTYEAPDHLRRRHSLTTVDAQLQKAASALAKLAQAVSGGEVEAMLGDAGAIEANEGIVVVDSLRSAPEALAELLAAIEANPNLEVFARIDHQAAAQQIELELDFATLVVFGSAAVGTPLMLAEDSVGLDLPLKILVAERNGATLVAYSTPQFLALRHGGLESQAMRLTGMSNALANLSAAAAGEPVPSATASATE